FALLSVFGSPRHHRALHSFPTRRSSDLYDGVKPKHPFPLALGHEISGRVVAAGAGAEGALHQPVLVYAVIPCGTCDLCQRGLTQDRKSTRLNSSHVKISYAVFCLKKKNS